jgi:hypothetical protein
MASTDSYLWVHLKTLVYAAPVDNEEALPPSNCGCLSRLSTTTPASLNGYSSP